MLDKLATNIRKCEKDDQGWQEIEKRLKEKGGYFSGDKNNVRERLVVDLSGSSRGRAYRSKSMSCKKDFGYIILSLSDDESVRFFSEEGCTASIPAQDYKQHIHWTSDNRCKPDRGMFVSLQPAIDKILWQQKPLQEGILVIVEYIKRDAQFIHGTPFVWLPSDRDFFVPSCYVRGFIHYRDEKYKQNDRNNHSREPARRKEPERSRDGDRYSSYDRDSRGESRNRDRDRSYESRDQYDRHDRDRSDRYDRSYRERSNRGGYDDYSSSRDRNREGSYNRENGWDRPPDRERSHQRSFSPTRRERKPSFERYDQSRDRGRYDRFPNQYPQSSSRPPNDAQSARPAQQIREEGRWPEPRLNRPTETGWPENNGNTRPETTPDCSDFASPVSSQRREPRPDRKFPEPSFPQQSPNHLTQERAPPELQRPQPEPVVRNPIEHSRHAFSKLNAVKLGVVKPQPVEVQKTPPQPVIKPKVEKKPVINPRFNPPEVMKRLRLRRKRSQCVWMGVICFDKFELKTEMLSYREGINHRISENRIHFTSRIPLVVATDLIKIFNQHIKQFNSTTLIKGDSLLNGSWTAFPIKINPQPNREEMLKSALNNCPLLMAKSLSSNLRIFMIRRDLLKNLNRATEPGKASEIFPERELFYPDPPIKSCPFVFLIHSHLTGHCSTRELREFQNFNRSSFFQQAVYDIQPHKFFPHLPSLSPTLVADCIRSIEDHRNSNEYFHRQLEEFWLNQSEHEHEIAQLTNDHLSATQTSSLLNSKVFNADRHAKLLSIISRKFTTRIQIIQELLNEQNTMKNDEIKNQLTRRPITPPPAPSTSLIDNTIMLPKEEIKKELTKHEPIGEPLPKVRVIAETKDTFLSHLDSQSKAKDFALLKGNVPPSNEQKVSDAVKQLTKQMQSLRFVNLITMRHKGATLPDIVGEEMSKQFIHQLQNYKNVRLPSWFLESKKIRRGPDHEGNNVPIITVNGPKVKKSDLFTNEPDMKKRRLLEVLAPSPFTELPPLKPFMSTFRLGDQIEIRPNVHVTVENFQLGTDCLPNSELLKCKQVQLNYVRVTPGILKGLRLGQNTDLVEMNDGSDEEGERKGGLKRSEIEKWLLEVNTYIGDFETVLDNPRYKSGQKKGHYIDAE